MHGKDICTISNYWKLFNWLCILLFLPSSSLSVYISQKLKKSSLNFQQSYSRNNPSNTFYYSLHLASPYPIPSLFHHFTCIFIFFFPPNCDIAKKVFCRMCLSNKMYSYNNFYFYSHLLNSLNYV